MNFSIVIPVFNEEKNISLLVKKINFNLKNYKFEIIIVDDTSTDNSKKILLKLQKKFKKVRVLFRKNDIRDLSKSCVDGFKISKFDKIIVMDGDLQHNPKYIRKMLETQKKYKCDFVVAVRNLANTRIKGLSLLRQAASYTLIKFFNIFFGKKTIDPMSGFFLFKKKIFFQNKNNLFLKGFKILADLIYSKDNITVQDISIKFDHRIKGKSKLNFKILLFLMQFIFYRIMMNIIKK